MEFIISVILFFPSIERLKFPSVYRPGVFVHKSANVVFAPGSEPNNRGIPFNSILSMSPKPTPTLTLTR